MSGRPRRSTPPAPPSTPQSPRPSRSSRPRSPPATAAPAARRDNSPPPLAPYDHAAAMRQMEQQRAAQAAGLLPQLRRGQASPPRRSRLQSPTGGARKAKKTQPKNK